MLTLFLTFIDDEDDKELFEKIFYDYRRQMMYLALSIVNNEADAEDVVHDVFLRIAIRNMDIVRKINYSKDLRNYLLKATKNTALNLIKKRKQVSVSLDTINEYAIDGIKDYPDESFLEFICKKNDYEQVVNAIRCLDDKYRDVLYYHYVLELTVGETANSLNQTVAATKKQLVRGKKLLLKLLDIEGVDQNGNYKS